MKITKIFFVVFLSISIFTAVTVYGDNITKNIQVTFRNISILANGKQIQSEQDIHSVDGINQYHRPCRRTILPSQLNTRSINILLHSTVMVERQFHP